MDLIHEVLGPFHGHVLQGEPQRRHPGLIGLNDLRVQKTLTPDPGGSAAAASSVSHHLVGLRLSDSVQDLSDGLQLGQQVLCSPLHPFPAS